MNKACFQFGSSSVFHLRMSSLVICYFLEFQGKKRAIFMTAMHLEKQKSKKEILLQS